jgi:hypothetical protein
MFVTVLVTQCTRLEQCSQLYRRPGRRLHASHAAMPFTRLVAFRRVPDPTCVRLAAVQSLRCRDRSAPRAAARLPR